MCTDGELVGLARVLGVLAHGGGQFLHGGGSFFQIGRLLFGAARQVAVARGDFACGQGDAGGAGLDLADDLGQLGNRGVGIIAHAGEHAVELAVHACGQVASSDCLQQLRQLAKVAVGDLHHAVQLLDHHAEIVIETLRIATLAEVARCGSRCQLLDLRVDRQQAGLGRIHRFMQDRAAAGQAACIGGEVAGGVLVEHVDGITDRIEVFEDHRVDATGKLPVDAREVFRNAVADIRAGMHLCHQLGLLGEATQHRGHFCGGRQHAARLILAGGLGGDAEVAAGDGLDGMHGLAQRTDHGARDDHGQGGGDHDQQHDGSDDGQHAVAVGRVGVFDLALHLGSQQRTQRLQVLKGLAAQRAGLLIGDLPGGLAITRRRRFAQLGIGGEVAIDVGLHGLVQRALLVAGRQLGIGGQLLAHDRSGVVHALVVVGHLFRLVQHADLGQFIGAELTQLRAHFTEVLHRWNVVGRHRGQLGVGFGQANQGERTQHDGHQGGQGESHSQLAGDGQIVEPLHAGCSKVGRIPAAKPLAKGHCRRERSCRVGVR
ncbi:hypothetical protein D3C81_863720 [compost metagenome]